MTKVATETTIILSTEISWLKQNITIVARCFLGICVRLSSFIYNNIGSTTCPSKQKQPMKRLESKITANQYLLWRSPWNKKLNQYDTKLWTWFTFSPGVWSRKLNMKNRSSLRIKFYTLNTTIMGKTESERLQISHSKSSCQGREKNSHRSNFPIGHPTRKLNYKCTWVQTPIPNKLLKYWFLKLDSVKF